MALNQYIHFRNTVSVTPYGCYVTDNFFTVSECIAHKYTETHTYFLIKYGRLLLKLE